jgi:hypothetical protein
VIACLGWQIFMGQGVAADLPGSLFATAEMSGVGILYSSGFKALLVPTLQQMFTTLLC